MSRLDYAVYVMKPDTGIWELVGLCSTPSERDAIMTAQPKGFGLSVLGCTVKLGMTAPYTFWDAEMEYMQQHVLSTWVNP